MSERGFTVVEITIGALFFLVLLGAAVASVVGDTAAERVLTAQLGPELRARHALERIASDLRMAGLRGEDRDANGILDEGEDANFNGRLDADWSLPDGAVRDRLVFNRRVDLLDEAGTLEAPGVYAPPTAYRLDGERLVRLATRVDPATGAEEQRAAVIARGISGLRFARQGRTVTVALDVRLPRGSYRSGRRTLQTSVWLRN